MDRWAAEAFAALVVLAVGLAFAVAGLRALEWAINLLG